MLWPLIELSQVLMMGRNTRFKGVLWDIILKLSLLPPSYLEHWLFLYKMVFAVVAHLTQEPGVSGSIPKPATYYCFSFRWFKKGSCQLLARVCALSTG